MSEKGGPAFPCQIDNHSSGEMEGFEGEVIKPKSFSAYPGMSLRDYFAAKAMQSAQSDPAIVMILGPKPNADAVAEYAYWVADAMLAERAK